MVIDLVKEGSQTAEAENGIKLLDVITTDKVKYICGELN